PTHTYKAPGSFDVTLKITNSLGCYNAVTKSDLVNIADGVTAKFSLSSLNACKSPAIAVFKNESIGTGTLNYTWNFGDSTSSAAVSPTHKYKNANTYNVLLSARSAAGCTDSTFMQVSFSFPLSSFDYSNAACIKQALQFKNTSVPAPVSCIWH